MSRWAGRALQVLLVCVAAFGTLLEPADAQAQRDAELNFASFKAFYGAFKIDITQRLLKESSKTLTGLKIANVQIPSGRHKILLRVSDTKGRTAEKEIAFKVE